MKVAVVGSRNLEIDMIGFCIPAAATEIVSGGARGVDSEAKKFAEENNLKYTEFIPQYNKYGKAAPLKRNDEIIACADLVVAIWDGNSKGTKSVIDKCKNMGKSLVVFYVYFCEETGYTEINRCEYCNMTALDNKMLKKIIIAELDREAENDIDTELIKASIDAILTNKNAPLIDSITKEQLSSSFKKYYDSIFRDIIDTQN